jgi:catechol 2,3-dioxygenase-like lactoylglutathione lyase family enzyme
MQQHDLAIPILPCRSMQATTAFYHQLGFEGGPHPFNKEYGIFRRGDVELHFFLHTKLVPSESWAGCYIRLQDVNTVYQAWLPLHLPSAGIPRMDRLEDKPWGLREFALVDPDGNLVRIGQIIQP